MGSRFSLLTVKQSLFIYLQSDEFMLSHTKNKLTQALTIEPEQLMHLVLTPLDTLDVNSVLNHFPEG